MATYRDVQGGRILMGRLGHRGDLLAELTAVCQKENICLGRISAIGAVSQARLGFYDQITRQYLTLTIDHAMEIASLLGNVSLKDGEPFAHVHVVLADAEGRSYSGHLQPATLVFACEFIIEELHGTELLREPDTDTGLSLWKL